MKLKEKEMGKEEAGIGEDKQKNPEEEGSKPRDIKEGTESINKGKNAIEEIAKEQKED